jgi:DNA-binding CsgD family transcriptional regulator
VPYKHTDKKIPAKLDRRRKLTEAQKDEIRSLKGKESSRALARMFNVSRRTIQYILDPAKLEANKKAREARGGSKQYYDKQKNTKYMREHRRYKQQLALKGELEDKD